MEESSWEKQHREEKERKQRIVTWTMRGVDKGDTDRYEGEVYWGFFFGVGGEAAPAPTALFDTEMKAEAFAELFYPGNSEIHVGPVVVDMYARDNFEVPK